jgi:hypothetical protein
MCFPCIRCGAKGWVALLADTLQARYGLTSYNAAVPGYTAAKTLARLRRVLPRAEPRVVVVGLSLGNEGFPYGKAATAEAAEAVRRPPACAGRTRWHGVCL